MKHKQPSERELFKRLNPLAILSNPVRFKILLALFISDVLDKKKSK